RSRWFRVLLPAAFLVVSLLVGVFLIDRLLLRDLLAPVGLAFLRFPSSYQEDHADKQQENGQDATGDEGDLLPLRQPTREARLLQLRATLAAPGLDSA